MKNFDVNKLTGDEAKAIVQSLATGFQATIQRQQVGTEKLISRLEVDLSVARTRANPLKISFPFISVRVEDATDVQASCRIIPVDIADYQDDTLLKLNDSLEFDNGISNVYIINAAQPNKKMVLKFFTTARVRSGSMIIDQTLQSSFTVGGADSANDGFTVILRSIHNTLGTNGTFDDQAYAGFTGVNDRSFDTGDIYDSGGSNPIKTFQVPMGYTAEIIGIEAIYKNAVGSAAYRQQWVGVPNGTFFNPSVIYSAQSSNGLERLILAGQPFAQNLFPQRIMDARIWDNKFPVERKNRKFTEGQCLVFLKRVTTNAGAVIIDTEFYTMVRLTRNVGV